MIIMILHYFQWNYCIIKSLNLKFTVVRFKIDNIHHFSVLTTYHNRIYCMIYFLVIPHKCLLHRINEQKCWACCLHIPYCANQKYAIKMWAFKCMITWKQSRKSKNYSFYKILTWFLYAKYYWSIEYIFSFTTIFVEFIKSKIHL